MQQDEPLKQTYDEDAEGQAPASEEDLPSLDLVKSYKQSQKYPEYKNFQRPPPDLSILETASIELSLMLLDTAFQIVKASNEIPSGIDIKIYAINHQGNSVLVHVKGYFPYFYIPFPTNLGRTRNQIQHFKQLWNSQILRTRSLPTEPISNIQIAQRTSIQGFSLNPANYLKVSVKCPSYIQNVINSLPLTIGNIVIEKDTFEANTNIQLQFQQDKQITGMGWFKIPANNYTLKPRHQYTSTCQIEIECNQNNIERIPNEGFWSKLAPIRVLSLKVVTRSQREFSSEEDPIIQIGYVCKSFYGRESNERKGVLSLRSCPSPQRDVELNEFQHQVQLLIYFQQLLLHYDPDILIGYELVDENLTRIITRSNIRNLFNHFGRSRRVTSLVNRPQNRRQASQVLITGRVVLDLHRFLIDCHQDCKELRSTSIQFVTKHFLGYNKDKLSNINIRLLFDESERSRSRLAFYTVKQASICLQLLQHLQCVQYLAQIAKITGLTMQVIINYGQIYQMMAVFLKKTKEKNMIIPTFIKNRQDRWITGDYNLFTVQQSRFIYTPVTVLNFGDIKHSIIKKHNICYTTLTQHQMNNQQNLQFVSKQTRNGVLPQLIEELEELSSTIEIQATNAPNQQLKKELKARLNATQQCSSSLYSLISSNKYLPTGESSQIVKAIANHYNNLTQDTVNTIQNIFERSQVIFQDAKNIFIRFRVASQLKAEQIIQSIQLGNEAALLINQRLGITCNYSKTYAPFLFLKNQCYAGLLQDPQSMQNHQIEKVDSINHTTFSRKHCQLRVNIIENVLRMLFEQRNINEIGNYIKAIIQDLYQYKVDFDELIETREVRRPRKQLLFDRHRDQQAIRSKYTQRNTHIMLQRTRGSPLALNDDQPLNVFQRDKKISIQDHYINKNIKQTLKQILLINSNTPLINQNVFNRFFIGEHTRDRYEPYPTEDNSLTRFIRRSPKCIYCNGKNNNQRSLFCQKCQQQKVAQHGSTLDMIVAWNQEVKNLTEKREQLLKTCRECQGIESQIKCQNSSCKIYYQRRSTIKKAESAEINKNRLNEIISRALAF